MTHARPHSANLRAEMTRAGVEQRELAGMLGTYQPDISWRMKAWHWREGQLQRIADYLDVPLHAIEPGPVAVIPVHRGPG